ISRELKRNQQGDGTYSSVQAEEKYHARREGCCRQPLLANPELHDLIQRLILDHQWSPEQIDQRLKQDHSPWKISYTTIYRGIEAHLLDEPNHQPGQRGIARRLRHRGKSRHGKGYEERRGKINYSHSIDERPPEANERRVIGHWEADTVVGKIGSECLVTLVDRKTRLLIAAKAAKKTAKCVKEKLIELFSPLPRHQRLTVTPDRGKEFAWYDQVAKACGMTFYFPNPHAPWQRGSNENTNGLLREYFPKGHDFRQDSDAS
ncbi:IS30 family transposase, partial [Sporolactobacillus terrae]